MINTNFEFAIKLVRRIACTVALGLFPQCVSTAHVTAENSIKPVMTTAGGYKPVSRFDIEAYERENPTPTMFTMASLGPEKILKNMAIRHLKTCTSQSTVIYSPYGSSGGVNIDGASLDGEVAITNAYPVVDEVSFGAYKGFPVFVYFSKNFVEFEPRDFEDGAK